MVEKEIKSDYIDKGSYYDSYGSLDVGVETKIYN